MKLLWHTLSCCTLGLLAACSTTSPLALDTSQSEASSTRLVGSVQDGQIIFQSPLTQTEYYAGEIQIELMTASSPPEQFEAGDVKFTQISTPDPVIIYGSDLDTALNSIDLVSQLTVPVADGTLVTVTIPTHDFGMQLIYQGNPGEVKIEDVALVLATLQVDEPKTAEAIATRANDLLRSPGLISPDSLNPVPDTNNTNYVDSGPESLNIVDVAAVLARIQVGPDSHLIADRINSLLDLPEAITPEAITTVPGSGLPELQPGILLTVTNTKGNVANFEIIQVDRLFSASALIDDPFNRFLFVECGPNSTSEGPFGPTVTFPTCEAMPIAFGQTGSLTLTTRTTHSDPTTVTLVPGTQLVTVVQGLPNTVACQGVVDWGCSSIRIPASQCNPVLDFLEPTFVGDQFCFNPEQNPNPACELCLSF